MIKPEHITFTGVDDWTDLDEMKRLSAQYPIEWGVLFSTSRQGIDPRYPSESMLSRLTWSGLRIAAHLCGQISRDVMAGKGHFTILPVDLGNFGRLQVNAAMPDVERIVRFSRAWGIARPPIAQHREGPFPDFSGVNWLFDCSGGTGVTPSSWPDHPGRHRFVGYAGGLNPSNVLAVMSSIAIAAPYWIDMESGVRTNDRFDLGLCRQVCEAVYGF